MVLVFPMSLPGRTCTIPEYYSDPLYFPGNRSKNEDKSRYFCQVTIVPDYTPQDCKADYSVTWDVFSLSKVVVVPDNVSYSITVDFYERCATGCGGPGNAFTRTHFSYTINVYARSTEYIYLNYIDQDYSCL